MEWWVVCCDISCPQCGAKAEEFCRKPIIERGVIVGHKEQSRVCKGRIEEVHRILREHESARP